MKKKVLAMFATTGSRWAAAIVVCVVTLVAIGAVVLTTTPLGCQATNALGVRSARCVASVLPLPTPTPSLSPSPTALVSASASPSAAQSPSPSPSPSPTALPSGTLPLVGPLSSAYPPFVPAVTSSGTEVPALPLTCRLPVYAGPPGSGGFIQFPGGNFVADPSSAVTLPPVTPAPSPPPPYGYQTALSYDQQFSRWVPVVHSAISPDGAHYAFASGSHVYVVDVRAGTVSDVGSGQNWQIVGLSDTVVYAVVVDVAGLWSLPFSGTPHQLTQTGFWSAVSSTAAYGTPTSAMPQGVANTIQRLDLSTGQITDWFSVKAAQSQVAGLDNKGNLVVSVYYSNYNNYTEEWVATGRGVATPIVGNSQGVAVQSQPIADGHGLWFVGTTIVWNNFGYYQSGPQGVVLYVAGYGLYWMSSLNVQLAGGCA